MSDPEPDAEQVSDARAGWECARLLELARTAGAISARLGERLAAFDAKALARDGGLAVSASELDRVVSDMLALQDAADVMGFLAQALRGRSGTLVATSDEIRVEAARALAEGSADPPFVIFAAGFVDVIVGFPALAEALEGDPSLALHWGATSLRELLGAFAASDPALVRGVCARALVDPGAQWRTLDANAIGRLVGALRGAADG